MFSAIGQSMAEENIGAINAQEGEWAKRGSREFDNTSKALPPYTILKAVLANETTCSPTEGTHTATVAAYSLLYGNASQNRNSTSMVPRWRLSRAIPKRMQKVRRTRSAKMPMRR
jgi:hypothetical protein